MHTSTILDKGQSSDRMQNAEHTHAYSIKLRVRVEGLIPNLSKGRDYEQINPYKGHYKE